MVSAHSKQSLLKGILVVYLISFGTHCSALNLVDCGTKDAEVKFIYSEKATKFCEISTVDLSNVVPGKSTVEMLQNFEAFSKYRNFKVHVF